MAEYPSIDFLTLGYVASSVGPGNAFRLFNIYTQSPDCRLMGIHFYPGDNSYRVRMPNGQPGAALCYKPNPRGAVVQQTMWQPAQRGDVLRHVDDAGLLPPVFFVCPDLVIGLPMKQVLEAPPGSLLNIFNSAGPAPLGGIANTHFCLRWPGYPEIRKQVELRNASRAPITMSKLVERIARFVERFIEDQANQPMNGPWRVGPGGITRDHIFIVGINQVSRGVWQPILQLNFFNTA
ncbi:hypothetical protein PENSPDRAFT_757088 [Peniophora sp. CONT]|nr:hypothetical protein PENSPDRAFT_757088 [Peniophora sp. CONT]